MTHRLGLGTMNLVKPWLATIVGVIVAVLLLILFSAAGSGDDTSVKGWLWILPILAIVAGLAFDLVVRQKKVKI